MRIYEIARRYALTSKETIVICHELGITVKAAQSAVKGDDLDKVIHYFEAGKDCAPTPVEVQPPQTKVSLQPIKHVVYVTTECQPFIEIGALGKLAQDAIQTLKEDGCEVTVFLPYSVQLEWNQPVLEPQETVNITFNHQTYEAQLYKVVQKSVTYYMIKEDHYFTREHMYGYEDDINRFAFFNHAVLQLLPQCVARAEKIYVNDWHTSLVPLLLHTTYKKPYYQVLESTLTVHNLEFQGWFNAAVLEGIIGISEDYYTNGVTRMGSCVNLLKSGIVTAHHVQVTERAKAQLEQYEMIACGISGVLKEKLVG